MDTMLRTTLLTSLASMLLCSAALAMPVLKANVVVVGSIVTVGDMFDDAGVSAEDALFRAPQPGTTGSVPLADVTAAAARIGIENFDPNGLSTVRVSRAASLVDETMLADLISVDLASRGIIGEGMSAELMFATPFAPVNAEAVDQPVEIVSLRYLPASGSFNARVAIAGQPQPIDLVGTAELMIEVPHLVGSLPAGTLLTEQHVAMRAVPLRFVEASGVMEPEQVIGMALTRQTRDGMLLRPSDVATPMMIARNDPVTIYFRQGPMTLSVKGQAITGATTGGPIQVLNLMSNRVISATALAPGAVEVSGAPLTLAGL
jgi:flagella basal body P-ring formation protein FlgA